MPSAPRQVPPILSIRFATSECLSLTRCVVPLQDWCRGRRQSGQVNTVGSVAPQIWHDWSA
eukprot:4654349-Lingulodinium_polyedra.AAC.1